MAQRASVSPPRHRVLAEQSVEVSENRGLERDHLEGDDLLLPEFDLPLAGSGEFAAGDQKPFALRENFRCQRVRRNRQDVDSVALPDTAAIMTMSMPMPMQAPAPAAPTAWPVDPVTGQTLVNGVPVVGRVFIMEKPDGLVKIASVASALAKESMVPEAPVVASNRAPLPGQATRRLRTAMAQATLWELDHKRSAVRNRHFRETTSGASLGQR